MQRLTTAKPIGHICVIVAERQPVIMASELHMKANTALIGAGLWGRNIARNLADLGALKGIYDHSHRGTRMPNTF